jgi:hypothetical protein
LKFNLVVKIADQAGLEEVEVWRGNILIWIRVLAR